MAARLLLSLGSRRAALLCGGGVASCGVIYTSTRPALCAPASAAKAAEPAPAPSLEKRCLAEAIGTGIIVQGGCGVVCALKYAGANPTLFGLATIWGASVALAAYSTRAISGAHLNPAVTCALVANDLFPIEEAPQYVGAQLAGATLAGTINYAIFATGIAALEASEGIVRGAAASTASYAGAFGMVPNAAVRCRARAAGFCCYCLLRPMQPSLTTIACARACTLAFGLPPLLLLGSHQLIGPVGAFVAEVWMTGILLFLIAAITDEKAGSVPAAAQPALIGTTVAVLIGTFGPVTGCGMNPARDLGPRAHARARAARSPRGLLLPSARSARAPGLFATLPPVLTACTAHAPCGPAPGPPKCAGLVTLATGWGSAALTSSWVYTLGPLIGGPLGMMAYRALQVPPKKAE